MRLSSESAALLETSARMSLFTCFNGNADLQAENFDAEVEELQPGKKKGKPPPRLVHAEESASRHRIHVKRLEQVSVHPSTMSPVSHIGRFHSSC